MKNIIIFLLIILYLISIFYINNIWILTSLIFVNVIIMILCRLNLIGFFKSVKLLLPFVMFTSLINFFLVDYKYAIFIGIRLLLSYMISYILIKILTIKDFVIVIENILSPLKLLKIDYKQISLIIFIAMSIVPNMLSELQQKVYSIKSKSIKMNFKNIFLIIKSILLSMILKINEYEDSLISKGYKND